MKQRRSAYEEMEHRQRLREKDRAAFRNATWLTFEEEEALLPRSANYEPWKNEFIERFESLRANGVHAADKIARVLNHQGFKTLSGAFFSARLVAVLRDKYRKDGELVIPPGASPISNEQGRDAAAKRRAHPTYRPTPEPEPEPESK